MTLVKYSLKNGFYKFSLIGIISILLILNLINFSNLFKVYSLIPLLLQVLILISVFSKNKSQEIFIKIWSILLIIGGLAGLISGLAALLKLIITGALNVSKFTWPYKLDSILYLTGGFYFFISFKKNITINEVNQNNKNSSN
jgi:hypothetical protein